MLPLPQSPLADAIFEYKVKRNGKITRKKSDEDQSFFTIPQNRLLRNLPGSDNFSYAQHDGRKYKYIVDDGIIGDFRKFNDKRKKDAANLQRAQDPERIRKGKKQVGNIFTVTDAKVGDEIFRLLGGNTNVEFGETVYQNDSQAAPQSQIWTNKKRKEIELMPMIRLRSAGNKIIEQNHSHPFDYNDNANTVKENRTGYSLITKYPSKKDKEQTSSDIKFNIYSSWSPDPKTLPHKMEYNKDGLVGYKGNKDTMTKLYLKKLMPDKKF